jgi:hypothetical protein
MKTAILFVLITLAASPLFAHREDYIGETLVFLTLERHSLEPELFADLSHSDRSYNAAIEYGVTAHFMVDARVSRGDDDRAGRIEFRYRLGDEGVHPIDIALSGEINYERERGETMKGFEPRLILSKDFDRVNVTLNASREIPFSGGGAGYQLASGMRFDSTDRLRIGTEALYDSRAHRGSLVPQIWIVLPHETLIRAGWFAGFGGAPHFVRIGIEIEL